jgi:DNA-binding transcriptional ArsR family regulator
MAKNNFLLVDLKDKKTQKLAETITSLTSRKILDCLAEQDGTKSEISKKLNVPLPTVSYHLQKLQEAELVISKEFSYSKKGRVVDHYSLANKYIIIAPKKVSGLKQKLQGILPVAIISLGISVVLKVITLIQNKTYIGEFTDIRNLGTIETFTSPVAMVAEESAAVAGDMAIEASPELFRTTIDTTTQTAVQSQPDIALWFFLGSFVAIILYILILFVKEWLVKRKK